MNSAVSSGVIRPLLNKQSSFLFFCCLRSKKVLLGNKKIGHTCWNIRAILGNKKLQSRKGVHGIDQKLETKNQPLQPLIIRLPGHGPIWICYILLGKKLMITTEGCVLPNPLNPGSSWFIREIIPFYGRSILCILYYIMY